MRKSGLILFSIVIIIFVLSLMNIFAAGSGTITYQGTILKPDGKPPKDDLYNMRFSFWNVETGGDDLINKKWEETWENPDAIYVKDGCFSVALGSIASFPQNLFKENPLLWLQIEIDLNQNNIFELDEIFATRAAMTATPYTFQADNATTATFAQNAATLEGLKASDFAITGHSHYYLDAEDGDPTKAVYVDNDGNVGIGTTEPGRYKLNVNGYANMDALFLDNGEILSNNAIQFRDLGSGGQKIEVSRENIGYTYGADFTGKLVVNGNVGIGTRYPTELLEVAGNFRVGGSSIYVNSDSDKVGIGTTSPTETLDIQGAVKLGNTTNTNPGTIRWTGTDFEGYNGSEWVSLITQSSGGGVPSGAIIMWSGAINDIPQDWFLCDGTNNTPDLSDRFILGVTQNSTANVGDSGPTSHAGGGAIFGSDNDMYYKTSGYVDGSSPGVRNDYQQTNPVQAHKHEFMPRYYALAYIMKE